MPIEKTHIYTYIFKNISSEGFDEERKIKRFKKYKTIKCSSKFQVIVFEPHKKVRASTQHCTGKGCQQQHGPCKMFKEYDLNVQQLKSTCLRSGLRIWE